MLPTFIRSSSDFASAIKIGHTTESLVLDFKETSNPRDPKWQKETCRDIAQFANTWGGCLLIGVAEATAPHTRLKVAGSVRAVPNPEQLRGQIEQAIQNHLVPSTISHDITPVDVDEGIVLAVNVEASRPFVYVWDRESGTIQCVRRTSHGKAFMNPDEMERHLLNGSRAMRLTLEEVVGMAKSRELDIAGGLRSRTGTPWPQKEPPRLGVLGDIWFEVVVNSSSSNKMDVWVPYAVVKAVWPTSSGGIGLLLGAKIASNGYGGLTLLD